VSWQIVPSALGDMLQDKDAARANRVMQAMLRMDKLDIAQLKQAYERP
jgi:predicted 3-demethylubiquinone-9 3-methyltransferase (glyoxalase superfamily)